MPRGEEVNQSQIKYARERAGTLRNGREKTLREKHTTPSVSLSCEEKLKALKDGRFKVVKVASNDWWHKGVNFTDEVKGGLNQKAFDKDLAELNASYTKLIDELVLGDNEEALRLLKAFEAA
jgi:hypothetical protein